MADPQLKPVPAAARQALQCLVIGRVEASRPYKGQTYTRIRCPSADEYELPAVVEVRSARKLGNKGDTVRVECRVGGFTRRAFDVKDNETGELRTIIPVDVTLTVVDDGE